MSLHISFLKYSCGSTVGLNSVYLVSRTTAMLVMLYHMLMWKIQLKNLFSQPDVQPDEPSEAEGAEGP